MTDSSVRGHTVGWIGTGRMGYQIAQRLLDGGCDLAVWNRTRSKARAPCRARRHHRRLPGRSRRTASIVFTMVAGPEDFQEVTTGPAGVLSRNGDAPIDPDRLVDGLGRGIGRRPRRCSRRAARRVLAAPVSGNPNVVKAGRLTVVVVRAARGVRHRAPRIWSCSAAGVTYVGDGDAARLVKICHNLFLGVVAQSMAEIAVLAERGGVPRRDFFEFLNQSVLGSTFTRYKTPAYVNRSYSPTFTLELLRKDFDLGLDAGDELNVPLPTMELVRELVQDAIDAGYTGLDFASLLELEADSARLQMADDARAGRRRP